MSTPESKHAEDGEEDIDISKAKVLEKKPLDTKDAKWLKLTSIKYADPTGRHRLWEAAERTTRPSTASVDAVGVVAIIRDGSKTEAPQNKDPQILLLRQFRPPAAGPVIELPAGLLDASESPEQCAIRELNEETGFTASSSPRDISVGPKLWNDPGMVATTVAVVRVVVELEEAGNRGVYEGMLAREGRGRKGEDGGEFMEVFCVGVRQLARRCRDWDRQGVAVDARVGGLAEGVEMAASMGMLS